MEMQMTGTAAHATALAPRLRLVQPDDRPTALCVTPATRSTATAAVAGRRRPLFERLRPHLPCRSDATELRNALAALGPAWRIVRGLTDDGVHSLLVGPGGIFALTVQSLPNARVAVGGSHVTVDGRPVALVPQRRLVADGIGRRLSGALGTEIRVRSLVGVIHAEPRWSFREQPADGRVTVLPGRDVAAFLAAQAPVLSADDVERIAAAVTAPARPSRPVLYAILQKADSGVTQHA